MLRRNSGLVERDDEGRVIRARGVGQDYRTRHPDRGRHHFRHWESKKVTARFWDAILQARKFSVELEMHPDNSFYWREPNAVFSDLDEIAHDAAGSSSGRPSSP